MATSTLYAGEASGARVLALGRGVISQVGDNYQLRLETWPVSPAGPTGDCLFRLIGIVIECVGGYDVTVTPIVDGVDLPPQTFTGSATGRVEQTAHVNIRGASIAARVTTNARPGDLHVLDITYSAFLVRQAP